MNPNTENPVIGRTDIVEGRDASPSPDTDAWLLLCDFDGTITPSDTADCLIEAFGNARCQSLESSWLAGDIGSMACMGGQIGELRASRSDLDRMIDGIDIDPGFPCFVETAHAMGFEVRVVSDGLDYVIKRILERYGLGQLPIYANHLTALADQRWHLAFPFAREGCASGHCKCTQAQAARRQGRPSLLIGDGTSDFCVAAQADWVWAKGRLAAHCQQHKIAFEPLQDFEQARAMLSCLNSDANELEGKSHGQRNRVFA